MPIAAFLTLGNTIRHSAFSRRSDGMLSGMSRISFITVPHMRSRSSCLPCAESVVDIARTAIRIFFMQAILSRLARRMELQHRVQRRKNRYRHAELCSSTDGGALQGFDLDGLARLEIDEER